MSEEKSKKSKIDLKARLGKTIPGGGSSPSAVPLPVPGNMLGSAPPGSSPGLQTPIPRASSPGIAPPPGMSSVPGISPGIQLPPFGPQPRPSAPAAAPPPPVAGQQTIKVEVAEEIHEERKKASKRSALYAGLSLLLGLGIGFGIGGAKERSDRGYAAIEGAGALEKDIKAANEKVDELKQKLVAGAEKLGQKQYPDDLVADLAGLNIPFEPGNLEHKQVGNLPATLQRALFTYTTTVEDVNKGKTQLRNLLGQPDIKKAVLKAWQDEKEPVANFSVLLTTDPKGVVAELVPTKDPFSLGKDWPPTYTVLRVERSQQGAKQVEKNGTRWQKGDPSRDMSGTTPVVIPVNPESTAAVTSQEVIRKLSLAMRDLRETIEGNTSDPSNERPGLEKVGGDLVNELHKIAAQK